jgi:hypothetical protein
MAGDVVASRSRLGGSEEALRAEPRVHAQAELAREALGLACVRSPRAQGHSRALVQRGDEHFGARIVRRLAAEQVDRGLEIPFEGHLHRYLSDLLGTAN